LKKGMDEYLFNQILDLLIDMESESSKKILVAGMGGSYSLGLQNITSDLDLFVVFQGDDLSYAHTITKEISDEKRKIDLMCLPISLIIENAELWIKENRRYPTVYYKTSHKRNEERLKKDIEREDFARAFLFRTLLSGRIWYMQNFMAYRQDDNTVDHAIRIIDICDYLFTRAYGNYNEFIVDKEFVPLRKYLYTMHEICSIKWLLKYETKPEPDFYKLIGLQSLDSEITEVFKQWYFMNRDCKIQKNKAIVSGNLLINKFFYRELVNIGNQMENINKEKILQFEIGK